jgi:hypothetical protein
MANITSTLQPFTASMLTSTGYTSSPIIQILPNTIIVRLDRDNFLLWKTHVIPNLSGQGYPGYIARAAKELTIGTGTDVITTLNLAYAAWWHTN